MPSLTQRIVERAKALPEAAPLRARDFRAFGEAPAIRRALARLARDGRLYRVCRGVYMLPVETRFGPCLSIDRAVEALAEMWCVTVAPSGGWCANMLGMITQVPIRRVYLTSGPDRRLFFNRQEVRWRRAPRWQLVSPKGFAGAVVRALAWLGPIEAEDGLAALERRLDGKLPAARKAELAAARAFMPPCMTGPVGAFVARA